MYENCSNIEYYVMFMRSKYAFYTCHLLYGYTYTRRERPFPGIEEYLIQGRLILKYKCGLTFTIGQTKSFFKF